MGVVDLVNAFNLVAEPRYTAQRATLGYQRQKDTEWQVITFYGIGADGNAFEKASPLLRPNTDLVQAATAVAQAMIGP